MLTLLAKESAIYGVATIVTAALGFFTLPFYTRVFSVEDFGTLSLIFTITALSGIISTLCLETAFVRYYSDKNYDQKALFSTIFMFSTYFGGVIAIFGFALAWIFDLIYFDSRLFVAGSLAIFSAFLAKLVKLISMNARMRRQARKYIAITLSGTLVGVFLSLLFVSYKPLLSCYFLGAFFGQLVSIIVGFRLLNISPLLYKEDWRQRIGPLLAFSVPLLPAAVSQYLLSSIDLWIIAAYAGTEAVAIYAVGSKVASVIAMFTSIVMFAFLPHSMAILQKERDVASVELERLLRLFSMLAGSAVIGLTSTAQYLLPVVAPEGYFSASQLVGFLALTNVFFCYTYFSTLGSWKVQKSADYSVSIVVGVVVNVVLNVALIPEFGVLAAAIVAATSMGVTTCLSFIFSARRYSYEFSYGKLFSTNAIVVLWICLSLLNSSFLKFGGSVELIGGFLSISFIAALNIGRNDFIALRLAFRRILLKF